MSFLVFFELVFPQFFITIFNQFKILRLKNRLKDCAGTDHTFLVAFFIKSFNELFSLRIHFRVMEHILTTYEKLEEASHYFKLLEETRIFGSVVVLDWLTDESG